MEPRPKTSFRIFKAYIHEHLFSYCFSNWLALVLLYLKPSQLNWSASAFVFLYSGILETLKFWINIYTLCTIGVLVVLFQLTKICHVDGIVHSNSAGKIVRHWLFWVGTTCPCCVPHSRISSIQVPPIITTTSPSSSGEEDGMPSCQVQLKVGQKEMCVAGSFRLPALA